ncbi:MAG: methylmalonyl Co-A mutase-associated GTPase MeaB [Acidimicrobiia bacterium]|nr:methylmalonyl Co-A mutase-associated GTPase MeaB [Acidimicrobiia bacterium]
MSLRGVPVPELFDRAKAGDRRALGRLLTRVERGGRPADEIAELTHPLAGVAHIIGITGAPGAGKSTLTGQLAASLSAAGNSVAVVAIDPSSPISGGAILGDRIRMDGVAVAESTFIRSMATRGHSGGMALAVPGAIRVLDAVGFDPVIIETVGVGQVEVEVAGAADTTVVVVTPGWGDAVQANKAGLLEVADLFAVNKADRPGARDARRDLELMLDLTAVSHHPDVGDWRPPILMTTATVGDGTDELRDQINAHRGWLRESGERDTRRAARLRTEVHARALHLLDDALAARLSADDIDALLGDVAGRTIAPSAAAQHVVDELLG